MEEKKKSEWQSPREALIVVVAAVAVVAVVFGIYHLVMCLGGPGGNDTDLESVLRDEIVRGQTLAGKWADEGFEQRKQIHRLEQKLRVSEYSRNWYMAHINKAVESKPKIVAGQVWKWKLANLEKVVLDVGVEYVVFYHITGNGIQPKAQSRDGFRVDYELVRCK